MRPAKFFLIIFPIALVLAGVVAAVSFNNYQSQAGCECVNFETADGEFESDAREAYYDGKKVTSSLAFLTALPEPTTEEQAVLGETYEGEKWIEVDLSEQRLKAWDGNSLFLETLVSSGKSSTPTITGEFRIWAKFQYSKMSGGIKGTKSYYYLPNVPYIMYFHNSYALHGTYWHANFGTPMSHGCVNLPTPIAAKLFYWTDPDLPTGKRSIISKEEIQGTRVVIHL